MISERETKERKSDEELLLLSIKNPAHFEELVRRYQEPFLSKARAIVGNREEVFDIVQDAFTKMYINAGRFKTVDGGSFRAWGYKIVVNTALTYYQRFKKENERRTYMEEEVLQTVPDKEHFSLKNRSFFEDEIVAVCSQMPRSLVRVFRMYFLDGLPQRVIAEKEGITEGALKTKLSRAKKEFKRIALESKIIS